MVKTATSNNSRGSKTSGNDIKFRPGDPVNKHVIIDVTDKPLQVIGLLPQDHTVSVYRVYEGDDLCLDVPDIPVMCKDGCSPLMLFNVPDPECPTGRFIQSSIWLFYQGRYKLVYNSPYGDTVIPEDVVVYTIKDSLVPNIGINLPLCGENVCPPVCVPKHAMDLPEPAEPTAPPDCLRCETEVAFHNNPEQPCDLSLYFWSKPPISKCSDPGEWKSIKFADWLDSLGGLVTDTELVTDGIIEGSFVIEEITVDDESDIDNCIDRIARLNLGLTCPPQSNPIQLTLDDLTDRYVWNCDSEGNITISQLTYTITADEVSDLIDPCRELNKIDPITPQELNGITDQCNIELFIRTDEFCKRLTLNDLAALINKCEQPHVIYTDPTDLSGFGVCFGAGTTTGFEWPGDPSQAGLGRTTITVVNIFDQDSLLEIDMISQGNVASALNPSDPASVIGEGYATFAHTIGEDAGPTIPDTGAGNTVVPKNWSFTNVSTFDIENVGVENRPGQFVTATLGSQETGNCRYAKKLSPGQAVTLYALWKISIQIVSGNTVLIHGGYGLDVKLTRGAA